MASRYAASGRHAQEILNLDQMPSLPGPLSSESMTSNGTTGATMHGAENAMSRMGAAFGEMAVARAAQRREDAHEARLAQVQAFADQRAVARIRAEFAALLRENADLQRRLSVQTERAARAENVIRRANEKAAPRRPS